METLRSYYVILKVISFLVKESTLSTCSRSLRVGSVT
jgi:hypothetical protein